MRTTHLIVCSIALFAGLVNECKAVIFKNTGELLKSLESSGESFDFPGRLRSNLEISTQAKFRIDEANEDEMSDGRHHTIFSFQDPEAGRGLIFSTRVQVGRDSESFYCKTDSEGKPLKSFIQRGKHDAEGKPVKGSAVVTPLEPDSKILKKRLKGELDFWLKGKGRKK